MSFDGLLDGLSLIDCTGTITHRLTVFIDGNVRVRVGEITAVIDPTTRVVSPSYVRLDRGEYNHQQVVDIACGLSLGR
ncbi:MAG: hypothetical protein AB7L13_09145 [Acidimicrobiia bacterium]